jgi:hypothetical protein
MEVDDESRGKRCRDRESDIKSTMREARHLPCIFWRKKYRDLMAIESVVVACCDAMAHKAGGFGGSRIWGTPRGRILYLQKYFGTCGG